MPAADFLATIVAAYMLFVNFGSFIKNQNRDHK